MTQFPNSVFVCEIDDSCPPKEGFIQKFCHLIDSYLTFTVVKLLKQYFKRNHWHFRTQINVTSFLNIPVEYLNLEDTKVGFYPQQSTRKRINCISSVCSFVPFSGDSYLRDVVNGRIRDFFLSSLHSWFAVVSRRTNLCQKHWTRTMPSVAMRQSIRLRLTFKKYVLLTHS